jgi:hypothetical protein
MRCSVHKHGAAPEFFASHTNCDPAKNDTVAIRRTRLRITPTRASSKDWVNLGPRSFLPGSFPGLEQANDVARRLQHNLRSRLARRRPTGERDWKRRGASSTAALVTSDFPALTTNRALQLATSEIMPVKPTSPATPGANTYLQSCNSDHRLRSKLQNAIHTKHDAVAHSNRQQEPHGRCSL